MSFSTRSLLLIGLCLVACEKEETSQPATKPADAGAAVPGLDPDLAQAVAAASAGVRGGSAPKDAAGGPPPNGIFAPGAADKEAVAGQPPKITLGSDGSEPRVALGVSPKPGAKQSGTIEVAVQNSPRQPPLPIEFGVTFEAQKPKGEEGVVNEVPVVVRVTSAKLGVAGAPKELEQRIAKLKGAKIEYFVRPDGAGTGYRTELPKGGGEELGDFVRALSETIAVATVPYPDKPVGAGAYWMATSRDGVLGLDLVTYRLVKVESVTPTAVTMSVNTKRYSAGNRFDLPGLPPDAPRTMLEFRSTSDGNLVFDPTSGFPTGGRQNSALNVTIGDPQNPNADRGMLEVHNRAELRLGSAK